MFQEAAETAASMQSEWERAAVLGTTGTRLEDQTARRAVLQQALMTAAALQDEDERCRALAAWQRRCRQTALSLHPALVAARAIQDAGIFVRDRGNRVQGEARHAALERVLDAASASAAGGVHDPE